MMDTSGSSHVIPIGILSRNRCIYLDATLRSLSDSALPASVPFIVFDDASDDQTTRRYLSTTETILTDHKWPRTDEWHSKGLSFLSDMSALQGIVDRVEVKHLADRSLGVVKASCVAISELFNRYPTCPAVILLLDDLVFNPDWYQRIVQRTSNLTIQEGDCNKFVIRFRLGFYA